jgi:RNA polymerase sigma-70 factor, ECF subfamily
LSAVSARHEFERMVDDHGAAVFAMLRRLCGNAHDAEDVFQDVAVRVWRSFPNRPRLRRPRAWLMTIAYRTFIDHRARRVAVKPLGAVADYRSDSADRRAEHADECRRVDAAMAELPDAMREVLALHYAGGLTLRQTADALDVSAGTVKSRLSAALAKLREKLA